MLSGLKYKTKIDNKDDSVLWNSLAVAMILVLFYKELMGKLRTNQLTFLILEYFLMYTVSAYSLLSNFNETNHVHTFKVESPHGDTVINTHSIHPMFVQYLFMYLFILFEIECNLHFRTLHTGKCT